MPNDVKVAANAFSRRQALHVGVMVACRKCGAGALYHDVKGVNEGCYDPTRKGQYVGDICPNCGAKRPKVITKRNVWRRDFRPGLWPVLKAATYDAVKSLTKRRR